MTGINKDPRDIILKPVVSEKSYGLIDEGKYTFLVDPRATKTEIKLAIEKIFGVKVAAVNTINRVGKARRTRFGAGKRKDTKRAIVTPEVGHHRHLHGSRLTVGMRGLENNGYSQVQAHDPGSPRLVGGRLRRDHPIDA